MPRKKKVTDDQVMLSQDPRGSKAGIDARKALEIIKQRLTDGNGYYVWTPLGEPTVWYLRLPNADKSDERWQKKERATMIHVCNSVKLVEALETNERENVTLYTGYIVDSTCLRCHATIPKNIEKAMQGQIDLHKITMKL